MKKIPIYMQVPIKCKKGSDYTENNPYWHDLLTVSYFKNIRKCGCDQTKQILHSIHAIIFLPIIASPETHLETLHYSININSYAKYEGTQLRGPFTIYIPNKLLVLIDIHCTILTNSLYQILHWNDKRNKLIRGENYRKCNW